jgi:hypothetical protein
MERRADTADEQQPPTKRQRTEGDDEHSSDAVAAATEAAEKAPSAAPASPAAASTRTNLVVYTRQLTDSRSTLQCNLLRITSIGRRTHSLTLLSSVCCCPLRQ